MSIQSTRPEESPASAGRSRVGRLLGVQVLGTGSSVPEHLVRNEDLDGIGLDPAWIVQRTGIHQRRHAPPGMATSDLAVEAGRRAIEAAGVDPQDIDLVLLGTFTPDMLLPATASVVQDRLGLRAPAVDLQAACASFMFAMLTGAQYVATGCSRLVLVIGADINSRVVNPTDPRTFPLFGDGAGAVLLGAGSQEQGFLAFAVGSEGSGAELLCRRMGGSRMPFSHAPESDGLHYLSMDGRAVFKWAVGVLRESTTEVLTAAGLQTDDIDLAIFHQANLRIISSAAKELGLEPEKVFNNLDRYGNTSSASIPLALDEACAQERVHRGDKILFSGFGAGLVWGTALVQW